jgi:hypothetical protein
MDEDVLGGGGTYRTLQVVVWRWREDDDHGETRVAYGTNFLFGF